MRLKVTYAYFITNLHTWRLHHHRLKTTSLNSLMDEWVAPEHVTYEEQLLKNPQNESLWLEYHDNVQGNRPKCQFVLRRAVHAVPSLAILWNLYLAAITNKELKITAVTQALAACPSVGFWKMLMEMVTEPHQKKSVLDSALIYMDTSHHAEVWAQFRVLAENSPPALSTAIYFRLYDLDPKFKGPLKEECISGVLENGDDIAATSMLSRLWNLRTITVTPLETTVMKVLTSISSEKLIHKVAQRAVLSFPHLELRVWLCIARFYESDDALAVHYYSKALETAASLDAFMSVLLQYTGFLESSIASGGPRTESHMALYEHLVKDADLHANSILVRNRPHLVDAWMARADIFESCGKTDRMLGTFVEALASINPFEAHLEKNARLCDIWLRYADFYAMHDDFSTASIVFSKAVKSQFASADELAEIYIAWTEMISADSEDEAIAHIETVLNDVPENHRAVSFSNVRLPVQSRVFKSPRLWAFYMSLLEQKGDTLRLEVAYNRSMDLGLGTLSMMFDHASKASNPLSVYENGLTVFASPEASFEIWKVLVNRSLQGDSGKCRETFERAIAGGIPGFEAKWIFDKYTEFELRNGHFTRAFDLLRRAIGYLTLSYDSYASVYDRKELHRIADDKLLFYERAIEFADEKLSDPGLVRELYTEAVKDIHLTMAGVIEIGLRFADFEIQHQSIDHARTILLHLGGLGSPADPPTNSVWSRLELFEADHGDQTLFKKMLKEKRKIQQEYDENQQEKLEINPIGFVKGTTKKEIPVEVSNPDAIDLDFDMD